MKQRPSGRPVDECEGCCLNMGASCAAGLEPQAAWGRGRCPAWNDESRRVAAPAAEPTAELPTPGEEARRGASGPEPAEGALAREADLLRALIDNMPDYIYVKDTASRFILNNLAHIRNLGATGAQEVAGKTDFDFFPRELAERYFADEQAVVESGQPVISREEPTMDKAGNRTWVSTTKVPLRDGRGRIVGLVGISRDITQRKQAQEALAWEAGVNAAVAELSGALIGSASLEDISSLVLMHARRLTGSRLGYVGHIDERTGYLVCPTLTQDIWESCRVEGKDIVFEVFRGLWGWVLNHRKPVLTNAPAEDPRSLGPPPGHLPIERFLSVPALIGEELLGQVSVANPDRDYDERDLAMLERLASLYALAVQRERADRALRQTAAELARSNAELEQFAYVASHDLQEPLRMVWSYVQLLERRYAGKLDADADEFIHFAVDGARRMQTLISDLLTYSRVRTRGKEPQPTDAGEVLEGVLANLRETVRQAGAAVTHAQLPTVLADRTQLGQVFQNLIGNAIKYRGEAPPSVHVSAEPDGDMWRFAVRDNGIGIEPEHHDRIFVVFHRLHGRDEYPGTGIGLAVCKNIVERHGGRIWVESEPGKGSTFYFTLPQEKPGGRDRAADGQAHGDPAGRDEASPAGS